MTTNKTPSKTPQYLEKPAFIVHLDNGKVVSVTATSLKEAVKMAKEIDAETQVKTDEEQK